MSTSTSRPVENCQVCNSSGLESILFVGFIPPVNTMPAVGSVAIEETAYPLELLRCPACSLVQIGLEVDQQVLFPESYPYLSGTTRILRSNFADLCAEASVLLGLAPDGLVIDIGSNDGTLLANFHAAGFPVLGIEPSQAADVAMRNGIDTLKTYFNRDIAARVAADRGRAQLITAANVFAHIGDIHSVVDGIVELLAPRGVFVSESHYLLDLVETLQYDTIYHEHLRYYSLGSLQYLLAAHGLEVFHIKRIPTHGGSIRVYSARRGEQTVQDSVHQQLALEASAGLVDGSGLKGFRERVIASKVSLYELIGPLRRDGARIYGIGAPSRASTLINYIGIDDGILDAVMEVSSSHKINRYIPGTRIPVLDEARLYQDQPEYALLLSWHIAEELAVNLRKGGYRGRFITPLPVPRVLDV
jgi:SAM-dependent methyltransferase